MTPSNAFISYVRQGDRIVLTHIEVDPSRRNSGIGARFAMTVLGHLLHQPYEIYITCPFLCRVAAMRPDWRAKFRIGGLA